MAEAAIKEETTGKILSFEEYTKLKKKGAADSKASALAYAADARAEAERIAGTNLNESQTAIENAYRSAQTGYGRQAETLARAGLTGSGYSDNLTRDAYATRASGSMAAQKAYGDAMQAAAREESSAIHKANDAYDSALQGIADYEREHAVETAAAYGKLLNAANNGEYSPAALEEMAKASGLTDEQTEAVIGAYNTQSTAERDQFDALVSTTDAGAATEAARLQSLGVLTEDDVKAARTTWQSNIKTDESAFIGADGQYMSSTEAKAELDRYKSNAWKTEEQEAKLQATYDRLYTPKTSSGIEYTGGRDLSNEGRNFSVTYNGYRYYLQSAGEITDAGIKSAAATVGNNQLFALNGSIYIKKTIAGVVHVYAVEKRGWAGKNNSYTKLLNVLEGNTDE